MNMKDICFIIPYFGKFNNYFQLFLNSCAYNENCDWIIITDDERQFIYPENIIIKYCTFEDICKKIRGKFDFDISIETPYKLCDYRPFYGRIFSDFLAGYKFWGHCDIDMIFGNISSFIKKGDMEAYDKIGIMGHCTIYTR